MPITLWTLSWGHLPPHQEANDRRWEHRDHTGSCKSFLACRSFLPVPRYERNQSYLRSTGAEAQKTDFCIICDRERKGWDKPFHDTILLPKWRTWHALEMMYQVLLKVRNNRRNLKMLKKGYLPPLFCLSSCLIVYCCYNVIVDEWFLLKKNKHKCRIDVFYFCAILYEVTL